MRDLIKILIAFAFITVAFVTGKYMATVKCSSKINELDFKLHQDKGIIIQLRDSLNITKNELVKLKDVLACDTVVAKTLELDKETNGIKKKNTRR